MHRQENCLFGCFSPSAGSDRAWAVKAEILLVCRQVRGEIIAIVAESEVLGFSPYLRSQDLESGFPRLELRRVPQSRKKT